MQIDLNSGDTPYVGFFINDVQSFIPFRHTLEFFTKSPDHDLWYFEDMDEEEFTTDMRKINDWEFIIALDRLYKHGTMICCANETIHGNRFSIHSKKNYHIPTNIHLGISFDIGQNGPTIFENIRNAVHEIENFFPNRFVISKNISIRPEGHKN